jgi:hypothetical protein
MAIALARHGRIGIEFNGPLELALRPGPVEFEVAEQQAERGVRLGRVVIEGKRPQYRLLGLRHGVDGVRPRIIDRQQHVAVRQAGVGQGIIRVDGNRLPEELHRLAEILRRAPVPVETAAQVQLVGLGVGLHRPRRQGGVQQRDAQGADHRSGDFILHLEDVIERAIEGLRPQVIAGVDADQLHRDPYRAAGLAHAALEYVGHVQRLGDLLDPRRPALEVEAGGARRHPQLRHPGEQADQLLGQAVGEVLLVLRLAHVDERQDRDRLFGRGERGRARQFRGQDRPGRRARGFVHEPGQGHRERDAGNQRHGGQAHDHGVPGEGLGQHLHHVQAGVAKGDVGQEPLGHLVLDDPGPDARRRHGHGSVPAANGFEFRRIGGRGLGHVAVPGPWRPFNLSVADARGCHSSRPIPSGPASGYGLRPTYT